MHSCISTDICQSTGRVGEVSIGVIASAHTGQLKVPVGWTNLGCMVKDYYNPSFMPACVTCTLTP